MEPITDVEILKETNPAIYNLIMDRAANSAGTNLNNLIEPVPAAIAVRIHPGGKPSANPVLIRIDVERVEYQQQDGRPWSWTPYHLGTPTGQVDHFVRVLRNLIGSTARPENITKFNSYIVDLLNSPDVRPTPGTWELPDLFAIPAPGGYLTNWRISFSNIEVIGDDYWMEQAEMELSDLRYRYAELLPNEEKIEDLVNGSGQEEGIADVANLLQRTLELAFPSAMERSDVLRASFYGKADSIPGNADKELGLGKEGVDSIFDGTPINRPGDLLLARLARVKDILEAVRNEESSPHSYLS